MMLRLFQFHLLASYFVTSIDGLPVVCRPYSQHKPTVLPSRVQTSITTNSRRQLLSQSLAGWLLIAPSSSAAAETVGKDPLCNDGSCIGVWDGLLANCPHTTSFGARCTCSQDDEPGIFSEPWDYSELKDMEWENQMTQLLPAIKRVSQRRGDEIRVLLQDGRYLRVQFTDARSGETSLGEFYFTSNDTTVQFRIASISQELNARIGSLRNIDRAELIRKELRYQKLPVLRNRKRALFFVEPNFDSFGPGSGAIGSPADMSTNELEGRD